MHRMTGRKRERHAAPMLFHREPVPPCLADGLLDETGQHGQKQEGDCLLGVRFAPGSCAGRDASLAGLSDYRTLRRGMAALLANLWSNSWRR